MHLYFYYKTYSPNYFKLLILCCKPSEQHTLLYNHRKSVVKVIVGHFLYRSFFIYLFGTISSIQIFRLYMLAVLTVCIFLSSHNGKLSMSNSTLCVLSICMCILHIVFCKSVKTYCPYVKCCFFCTVWSTLVRISLTKALVLW